MDIYGAWRRRVWQFDVSGTAPVAASSSRSGARKNVLVVLLPSSPGPRARRARLSTDNARRRPPRAGLTSRPTRRRRWRRAPGWASPGAMTEDLCSRSPASHRSVTAHEVTRRERAGRPCSRPICIEAGASSVRRSRSLRQSRLLSLRLTARPRPRGLSSLCLSAAPLSPHRHVPLSSAVSPPPLSPLQPGTALVQGRLAHIGMSPSRSQGPRCAPCASPSARAERREEAEFVSRGHSCHRTGGMLCA